MKLVQSLLSLTFCFYCCLTSTSAQVTIRVSTPENTPHDANLYITGDFNGWIPLDTLYQLEQVSGNIFQITLPEKIESFQYKITRGNWQSVEGRSNGRARPNRTFSKSIEGPELHEIEVKSWEDLTSGGVQLYTFFLLLSAIQGILLIIALNSIQDRNVRANRVLSLLLFLISFALIGRVLPYDREIFQWQPKILLLPELIFFIYSPIFYFYIQRLLKVQDTLQIPFWLHFVPAALHFLGYLPLWFYEKKAFINMVVDEEIHVIFAFIGALALIFNGFYWYRVWKILEAHSEKAERTQSSLQNLRYLTGVMVIHAVCLSLWVLIYLISAFDFVFPVDLTVYREYTTDIAWAVFAITTYILGFYAIQQPEIFKLPKVVEKYKDSSLSRSEMDIYRERLMHVLEQDKAYLQPDLTLGNLSEQVRTNTHTLSRVINEGFGRSFYDLINAYRVREFTRLILSGEYDHETYLSVAFRVGFNSKTTFNRAFKKLTGSAPRSFLKEGKAYEIDQAGVVV